MRNLAAGLLVGFALLRGPRLRRDFLDHLFRVFGEAARVVVAASTRRGKSVSCPGALSPRWRDTPCNVSRRTSPPRCLASRHRRCPCRSRSAGCRSVATIELMRASVLSSGHKSADRRSCRTFRNRRASRSRCRSPQRMIGWMIVMLVEERALHVRAIRLQLLVALTADATPAPRHFLPDEQAVEVRRTDRAQAAPAGSDRAARSWRPCLSSW